MLAILGPFHAHYDNQPLSIPNDKIRGLLAYLALESGQPHRRDTLANLLWPDESNRSALRHLRKSVYRLRQTLETADPTLPDKLITQNRKTIILNPAALTLDASRFKQLIQDAKVAPHPIPLLNEIAAIYQGEFLTGISIPDAYAFEEWLNIQRELFHQEAVDAMIRLTTLHEANNEPESVIKAAVRVLALNPWHERTYRQIMRAHLKMGNRPQAIARYEELKAILQQELGVEPGAETTALYEQIRREKIPGTQPAPTVSNQLHHFPKPHARLIGREVELEQLVRTLQDPACRLLTLTGPGGIGKTRLTIEVARQLADKGHFSDGIYFASLRAITEKEYLLIALAGLFGLSIYSQGKLQQQLQDYLANKNILLVLDNFEQLVGESSLLSELLQATQYLKILVSSRESLNNQMERRQIIGGMTTKSAIDLFLQSAARVQPRYKPDEQELEAIEAVCRLVVGIPLAIEMAAGWMKTLDITILNRQIKSNFEILKTAYGDVPERHQSMRAVFEESWRLLRPSEQKSLAQFSVFQGRFSLYAALEITDTTIDDMAVLLDKSLLEYPGESRYQLHELLRQFAESKLEDYDLSTRETLSRKYARFYMELVQRCEIHLFGEAPQFGMKDIQLEIDNIRHAWHLAIEHDELELISKGLNGLKMYFRINGRYEEGAHLFEAAINKIDPKEGSERWRKLLCRLWVTVTVFYIHTGMFSQANESLEVALEASTRENWLDMRAEVELMKGYLFYQQGKYIQANALLQNAIAYFETVDDRLNLAEGYYRLGICFRHSDRWHDTDNILTRALNISQELSFNWAVVLCLWALGYLYRRHGQQERSIEFHEKSIQLALDINFIPGVNNGYLSMGFNHEDLGNYEKAIEAFELAVKYAQETGNQLGLSRANGSIARLLWKMNRPMEALELINETLHLTRRLGSKIHISWQLIVKAEILFTLGRYTEAGPVNAEGLKLARETTTTARILQGEILEIRLQLALGQQERALNKLNEMVETAGDVFTSAAAYYELWRFTREEGYGRQALESYRLAYAKDPYIEYKERIEALEKLKI